MTKDYEPTSEQRRAIQAAVDASIMPLVRQVLVKKIGQAAVFIKEELDARHKPLLDSDIVTMYAECPRSDAEMIAFARAIERHVRGEG